VSPTGIQPTPATRSIYTIHSEPHQQAPIPHSRLVVHLLLQLRRQLRRPIPRPDVACNTISPIQTLSRQHKTPTGLATRQNSIRRKAKPAQRILIHNLALSHQSQPLLSPFQPHPPTHPHTHTHTHAHEHFGRESTYQNRRQHSRGSPRLNRVRNHDILLPIPETRGREIRVRPQPRTATSPRRSRRLSPQQRHEAGTRRDGAALPDRRLKTPSTTISTAPQ
jgi:hypothetical protein